MIEIESKKIAELITAKDDLVTEGRKITGQMEDLEKKVHKCEDKEKAITAKEKPDETLKAEGDALVEVFNNTLKRLEEVGQAIEKKKMDAIPKELIDEHKGYLKEIEKLERDRNKIALKVQKIKDRVIPLIQKEVVPKFVKREVTVDMSKFDDIETAKVKDGKVVIHTFNHLDDWKRKFKGR